MDNHSELPHFVSTLVKHLVDEEPDRPSKLLRWAREELDTLRWARKKLDTLDKEALDREIKALLKYPRCEALPLAIAINMPRILDRAQHFYSKIFGKQEFLECPIEEFEHIACLFDALPPELSSERPFRKTVLSPFRLYKSFNDEFRTLMKQMMSPHVKERYALCGYIEITTGRPHYREASVIISAMTGQDLDENALRQWRYDNKDLNKTVGWAFNSLWLLAQEIGKEHKKNN